MPPLREKCAVQGAQVVKCAERNNREIRPNPDPVREIFRDKRESDPKTNPEKRTELHEIHTSTEVVPTSAAHDLLDSTLRGGQLEALL